MNRQTIIILIAIGLIFLYWRNKRGKIGMACADLWDKMTNSNSEEVFINKMVEIDNNRDLKQSLTEQNIQFGYEYGKCIYTAQWMSIGNTDMDVLPEAHQLLSSVEVTKVKNCICEKLKSQ